MSKPIIAIPIILITILIGCSNQEYEVDVIVQPDDAAEIAGAGIYASDNEAVVTVQPNDGYEFVEWTQDGESVSTESEYRFEVSSDVQLQAVLNKTTTNVTREQTITPSMSLPLESLETVQFEQEGVSINKSELASNLDGVWETIGGKNLWGEEYDEVTENHPDLNNLSIRHEGLSPDETKLAFTLYNAQGAFPYSVVGYMDLETDEIYFTNATQQVTSPRDGVVWSSDGSHIVYTTVNESPTRQQAFIDSVEDQENVVTADFTAISEAELLDVSRMEWMDDNQSVQFEVIGQVGNRIETTLSIETGEFE
ncbi:hypothetical protein ABID56_001366 [Alkalibacillus flavidus]|uniref:Bacterial repeat domain-containing protein n=1 Tax=Alkalibacillus flavidus TaxID=546021 RepID=A0ABV2KUL4_9BACI